MEKSAVLRTLQLFLILCISGNVVGQEPTQAIPYDLFHDSIQLIPENDCEECIGSVKLPYTVRDLGPDHRLAQLNQENEVSGYYERFDYKSGFSGFGLALIEDGTYAFVHASLEGGKEVKGHWKALGDTVLMLPFGLDTANMVSHVKSKCLIDRSYIEFTVLDRLGHEIYSVAVQKVDEDQLPEQFFKEDTLVGRNLSFMLGLSPFQISFASTEAGATQFKIHLKYSKGELERYAMQSKGYRLLKKGNRLFSLESLAECGGLKLDCLEDWLQAKPLWPTGKPNRIDPDFLRTF